METKVIQDKNSITFIVKEREQHTLKDLKQKLINDMYALKNYEKEDIEILKILFEKKD